MKREHDPVIALRLPAGLVAAIDARATKQDVSRSVVIRQVLADVLGADVPKPASPPAKPVKARAKKPAAEPKVESQFRTSQHHPPADQWETKDGHSRPKAKDDDRCSFCGALYSLVGYTHRCGRR